MSGYGRLRKLSDGGSVWFFDGGASIGVPIDNTAFPRVLHRARPVPADDPAGRHARPAHLHADVENLCDTLA